MSAEEHDEPLHQAPWVFFATVGTCFGFLTLVLFAKMMTGGVPMWVFGTAATLFVVPMIIAMVPATH